MKVVIAILLCLSAALPAMADVTKDDIKKLANAGVSDQVMLSYIKAKGPVRMNASDLAELKKFVSDNVLAALAAGISDVQPQPEPSQTTVVVETDPVVYWYWGPYGYWPRYYYGGYWYGGRYYRPNPYYRPVYTRTVVRPAVVIRPSGGHVTRGHR